MRSNTSCRCFDWKPGYSRRRPSACTSDSNSREFLTSAHIRRTREDCSLRSRFPEEKQMTDADDPVARVILESWDRQTQILSNIAGTIGEEERGLKASIDGWR